MSEPALRRAGRPRDPRVHEAILRATAELLGEGGYAKLTIDGVAQRAMVTRQSIYRRWPSKLELVAELLREVSERAPLPDTGTLRGDLLALYRLYASNLLTPGGPIIPSLVAESMHDSELASILDRYTSERRVRALHIFNARSSAARWRRCATPNCSSTPSQASSGTGNSCGDARSGPIKPPCSSTCSWAASPSGIPGRSLRGADGDAHRPDAGDRGVEDVACGDRPNAFRRAGEEHVTGVERVPFRGPRDQFLHAEDEERRIGPLARFAVHPQLQFEIVRVRGCRPRW